MQICDTKTEAFQGKDEDHNLQRNSRCVSTPGVFCKPLSKKLRQKTRGVGVDLSRISTDSYDLHT